MMQYRIIIGLLTLLARFPLKILYLLSEFIYVLVYYVVRYRRKTVRHNLELVFSQKSRREVKGIERRFYRHFCDCIVETVKLLHISDEEMGRRVHVANGDLIEKIASDGRPIILFLGHYGNWEWVQEIVKYYRRPRVSAQVYRPLRDVVMERVMLRVRSRFGSQCIPQKRAFRTFLAMRQENEQFIAGFISDQRPNSSTLKHWTTFLGQDTPYNVGGEEIGRRVGTNYVYLDVVKERRGYYKLTFREMNLLDVSGAYPYTLKFMEMMEETILRAPEYWLWSHNRWKFSRKDGNNDI